MSRSSKGAGKLLSVRLEKFTCKRMLSVDKSSTCPQQADELCLICTIYYYCT